MDLIEAVRFILLSVYPAYNGSTLGNGIILASTTGPIGMGLFGLKASNGGNLNIVFATSSGLPSSCVYSPDSGSCSPLSPTLFLLQDLHRKQEHDGHDGHDGQGRQQEHGGQQHFGHPFVFKRTTINTVTAINVKAPKNMVA